MIRHYDMTTGEEIQDDRRESVQQALETASPRLVTVQEAVAMQTRAPRLPADMATLSVETILAKWS